MIKKIRSLYQLYKSCGLDYTAMAIVRRIKNGRSDDYKDWMEYIEQQEREEQQEFSYEPLVSVVVPVYNVKRDQLEACIQSVLNQTYKNVQLCLSDDCSTMPEVKEVLQKYEKNERVSVYYRTQNGHISENSNSAIALAKGEFVGFLDCDDFLATNAVYEIVKLLNNNPELDFIYSDEDLVTEDGTKRYSPIFKPDWSPDTYLSHNYTNHFSVYRTSIVREIGGLRTEYNGSQDYDFVLRYTEHTTPDRIAHIDKVLYHWRVRPESVTSGTDAKPYVFDAAKRATEDALARRGLDAHLEYEEETRQWNVVYHTDQGKKTTIFIVADGTQKELEQTMQSLETMTGYKECEKILLYSEEVSRAAKDIVEKIAKKYEIRMLAATASESFAVLCNRGVQEMNGEYIVYIRAGIEVQSDNWFSLLVGQASQAHTGIVGGKALYPGKKVIKSIGYVKTNIGYVSAFQHNKNSSNLYTGLNHNFSCVADGLWCMEREKLEQAGCWNETVPTKYMGFELSARLLRAGNYHVYRSDVEMIDNRYDLEISHVWAEPEKDLNYSKNFSHGIPFALENYVKCEKKDKVQTEENRSLQCKLAMHQESNRLYITGIAYSDQLKRTLSDDVWIEILHENGDTSYAKIRKNYMYGFTAKQFKKKGLKWAGFSGTVIVEEPIRQVRVLLNRKHKWYEAKVEMEKRNVYKIRKVIKQ